MAKQCARRRRGPARSGAGALLTALAATAAAQPPSPAGGLSGHVSVGVRSVDVDGAATKYREDVNLDDGARLLDLTVDYAPAGNEGAALDRLALSARSLGGDPFESMQLDVQKRGVYDLKLGRRRSEYFYRDVILPVELASVTGSTAGDLHHFDFERIHDRGALDMTLSPATAVRLGFDRYTRTGDSTTTLESERDEFELNRPLDEILQSLTAGIEHAWDKVTLIFEHDIGEFDNTSRLFLPGASPGQNTGDPAALDFFSLDQSYDYDSRGNTLRVMARPTERLDVKAAWRREDVDLDMTAAEMSAGTGFTGAPFATDAAGTAAVGRDITLASLDAGFAVSERLRVFGGVRDLALEQNGQLAFGGGTGAGLWDIETRGAEAGVAVAVTRRVTLTSGLSSETRDVLGAQAVDAALPGTLPRTTRRNGFFAELAYAAPGGLTLSAGVDDDDIDDAYALASPTASRRYRLRARYRFENGLAVTAGYRRTVRDHGTSGWQADTDQTNVSLAYATGRLSVAFNAAIVNLDRRIDQTVTAGTREVLYAIDYAADTRLVGGHVRWQAAERVAIGAHLSAYENSGSFPLERDDLRGFVEVTLNDDYLVSVAWRRIDHTEDGFDDYDAELLEVALGLRW